MPDEAQATVTVAAPSGTGETPEANPTPESQRDERRGDDPRDGDVAGLKSALRSERGSRREVEKALTEVQAKLKEFEDRDKTELERVTGERDTLKAQLTKLESDALRKQVAAEAGMSDLWEWLQGADLKELRANAAEMRQRLGLAEARDGGARQLGGPPQAQDMDSIIRRSAGRG